MSVCKHCGTRYRAFDHNVLDCAEAGCGKCREALAWQNNTWETPVKEPVK